MRVASASWPMVLRCSSGRGADPRGVDAGAFQHGGVGPAGVVVAADEGQRLVGPFAVVESRAEVLDLAPVGGMHAADIEHVAMSRLAVVAPGAQAPFQFVEADLFVAHVRAGQLQAAEHRVRMGVDQAGHQALAAEIDDLAVAIGQGAQPGLVADREDPSVLHRQGLGEGLLRIGGEDPGVDHQQVGGAEGVQGMARHAPARRVGIRCFMVVSFASWSCVAWPGQGETSQSAGPAEPGAAHNTCAGTEGVDGQIECPGDVRRHCRNR